MATRYAVVELELAESTQDEARERYQRSEPVLVVAGRQTAGRGRLGRDWLEPDRAVFTSLAFEPAWPIEAWSLIPLVAGIAARSAVADLSGVTVGLRWPNDLMMGDAKIGGLLAESSGAVVVVGCGVNLRWESPIPGADALFDADPGPAAAGEFAIGWADRLLDHMSKRSDDWGMNVYREACITIGRTVSYPGGSGVAVAISDEGSLLVETADGTIAVHSGEVRLHDRGTLPRNPRRN